MQLICAFVLAKAKCRFSHYVAHVINAFEICCDVWAVKIDNFPTCPMRKCYTYLISAQNIDKKGCKGRGSKLHGRTSMMLRFVLIVKQMLYSNSDLNCTTCRVQKHIS